MNAPDVHLNLFGSPTVALGASELALPFERRAQLAAFLALRRQWVPRAEIAATLWPELEDRFAFANLRKTLFRMSSLPWPAAIDTQGAALRLAVRTDVDAFEQALREERLADALAVCRGELLAGFDDGTSEAWTRWVTFERDRLRAAWRGAALALLAAPGADATSAIALSARLLAADPLDEAALQHHVNALARDGQAGAARLACRRFVERLAADLGLEPGAELRALHESLAGVARSPAIAVPPPPAPAAAEGSDGFIGRSVELRRIADLLALDECRLLCLVGPGGVGKTSLARHALPALAPSFAHGATFVTLEDVETPQRFGLRLAQEAGVEAERDGDDALAAAIAAWREQHRLLVLDNFEQLAGHAALLDALLQACPRLKLLVTSRLRLAVAGAWSMPIEGLPWPDAEDADRAESFDAVRVFASAARRVEPAFAAAAEGAAIADICSQVEGLPLALELAAAWVRVMPCAAIAEELRSGTELLRATDPRRPSRHASIEAVFEHSWKRLGVVERQTLSRLSVFRGGFSIDAARAVAQASLPVLGALVDKSLLVRDGARLRLHPLVQHLAALRLEAADRAGAEAAHAAHFLRWLDSLRAGVEDAEGAALQAIDADCDNCRRAWWVATSNGQADVLRGASRVLLDYFDFRGRAVDGLAWFQQFLDSPLCRRDVGLRARVAGHAAHLQYRMGRYQDADAMAADALAAAGPAHDPQTRHQALSVRAGCALHRGRLADARRLYRQALALAPAEAQAHARAAALDNLALVEKRMGHIEESLRLSIESLAQHRRLGDHAGVALCLTNLAQTCLIRNDPDSAHAHLLEALAISEREGEILTRVYTLSTLSELALKTGEAAAAGDYARRALELAERSSNHAVACWMTLQLARAALRRHDLVDARRAAAAGTGMAIALDVPALLAVVFLALAELLEAQGEPACARQVLAFAIAHPTISPSDRAELLPELARRTAPDGADPAWPALSIDELLHRVVAEADLAYAPLIALLHEGGRK